MAKIHVTLKHSLGKEEALRRVKTLLTKTKKEYGKQVKELKEEWAGNKGVFSFKVAGFEVSGTLLVNESNAILDGTLPFTASLFKGKITKVIKQKGRILLLTNTG